MLSEFSIDEYIKTFPQKTQLVLKQIRVAIKESAPQASEEISYGIPTFKLKSKNLVHFGGYKTHIGFYPGSEAIEVFKKDLRKYKTSKGTIRFLIEETLPLGLVKKIVKYRLRKLNV